MAGGIHLPGRRYNLVFIGMAPATMLENAQECNVQSVKLGGGGLQVTGAGSPYPGSMWNL